MASYFPRVGTWFMDGETRQCFEVVAIDEKASTIEVQYYDGDIAEFDIESWGSLRILESEAPEEAYAGFETLSPFGDEAPSDSTFILSSPLESIEPDVFTGYEDPY